MPDPHVPTTIREPLVPGAPKPAPREELPAAGPHAKPHLTDPMKTPGAGTLPDPDRPGEDATGG